MAANCNPARASNVQKPAGSDDAARAGTSEPLRLDRMIGRVRHSFEQSVLVAEQGLLVTAARAEIAMLQAGAEQGAQQ